MWQGLFQIALTLLPIALIIPILGRYLAGVYQLTPAPIDVVCSTLERVIYRLSQIDDRQMMTGWQYARAIFVSNLVMAIFVFIALVLEVMLSVSSTESTYSIITECPITKRSVGLLLSLVGGCLL